VRARTTGHHAPRSKRQNLPNCPKDMPRPLDRLPRGVYIVPMTTDETRQTISQMLKDWDAATPEQRRQALEAAANAAQSA